MPHRRIRTIPTSLPELRAARGLTIDEVARRMGSAKPHVSNFEQGRASFSDLFVARYARAVSSARTAVRRFYWAAVAADARRRLARARRELLKSPRRPADKTT